MRFHCGISFSWRTIKKFLIPFLLGILAIFGFNFILENKDNIPFGRILKVNALEDTDNYYELLYDDTNYYDTMIDSYYTFNSFVDYLNTINSNYYKFFVSPTINNNELIGFSIGIVPSSNSSLSLGFWGQNNTKNFFARTSINIRVYNFSDFTSNDITSLQIYSNFYSCFVNNTNCNSYSEMITSSFNFGGVSSNITSDSDYNVVIPYYNTSYVSLYSIYYSQIPIILSDFTSSNSAYIIKSIKYNDTILSVGDSIPTIKEFLSTLEPEPEPDPEPEEDTTNHKALFNKIFWFDDSSTEKGILTSIYELLLLYCLGMIILRILTIIKNTRW